jgi:hypothetical protein
MVCEGLVEDLRSCMTIYIPAMTVYFLPPPLTWRYEVRIRPLYPSYCSVGGVLMVRSDCKFWGQTESSSILTCYHMDLCYCSSHLIVFICNISPLPSHPWERESWVSLLGCHSAYLSRSSGCLMLIISFPLSVFGHRSCGPASPPNCFENHLISVDSVPAVPRGHHTVCHIELPLSSIYRAMTIVYCSHSATSFP